MSDTYQVLVDDNFHYRDEDERYKFGNFSNSEEALTACKSIVDKFLQANYEKGVTAEQLYKEYITFGEDPFIVGEPAPFFSAWDYARKRCREICGES